MTDYYFRMQTLSKRIMSLLAVSFEVEPVIFEGLCSEPTSVLRLVHYSPEVCLRVVAKNLLLTRLRGLSQVMGSWCNGRRDLATKTFFSTGCLKVWCNWEPNVVVYGAVAI